MKFIAYTHAIHLHIVSVLLVKLSSHHKDRVAHEASKVYYLSLRRKSSPYFGLEHNSSQKYLHLYRNVIIFMFL